MTTNEDDGIQSHGRRRSFQKTLLLLTTIVPSQAHAAGSNAGSRSEGYTIQKSDDEWKGFLTKRQYQILRNGGTESQYSSVLEGEERDGTYYCAGCDTALFSSKEKFHSGTGWPSFASGLEGVQVEKVNMVQAKLGGAELRCRTCGGHLGDVFEDGWIFTGTRAADTGKRYCIDGAALVFRSVDGTEVIGDTVPDDWEKRLLL